MDMIGIDFHKRESQLCILDAEGGATERRITTSRDRFTAVLGTRPPARILVEASTESEWVACHLEALGHEVVIADPNFAPMYATRSRRVKTDKRDALTLADALRLGAYRPAHRGARADGPDRCRGSPTLTQLGITQIYAPGLRACAGWRPPSLLGGEGAGGGVSSRSSSRSR